MKDGLAGLSFKDSGTSDFIRFKSDEPVKLRVFSTNPVVSIDNFGNTRYAFSVWNYAESRAMILNATPTVARGIHQLHTDEDYGQDVTKIDIKILPTGDHLERRYTINVLPKAQKLEPAQEEALNVLDGKLDAIMKNGVRALAYNEGQELPKPVEDIPDQAEDIEDLKSMFEGEPHD